MTDIETAKLNLEGHSVCFCKDGDYFTCDGRGISPLLKLISADSDLSGCCAADLIVGKAAAMLFIKMGIAEVFGRVMSKSAVAFLEKNGVPYSFDTLADKIINRRGDGICPMEQAVAGIDDVEIAFSALKNRVEELKTIKK